MFINSSFYFSRNLVIRISVFRSFVWPGYSFSCFRRFVFKLLSDMDTYPPQHHHHVSTTLPTHWRLPLMGVFAICRSCFAESISKRKCFVRKRNPNETTWNQPSATCNENGTQKGTIYIYIYIYAYIDLFKNSNIYILPSSLSLYICMNE